MRTIPRSVARWLRVGLVLCCCFAALAPTIARADTDLTVGGQAHVADAGGDHVRLRAGAGYDQDIITLVPEGTTVDVLDGPFDASDGSVWYKVSVAGETGYIVSDYLAAGAGDASSTDSGTSGSGSGSATVTTAVNLRAGPSLADGIVAVIPSGASVTLTGDSQNGFRSATYQGNDGWIFSGYLDSGDGAPSRQPATTTDDVNLRTDPSSDAGVIVVMPAGAAVALTGQQENGYVSVDYQGTDGWAAAAYISASGSSSSSNSDSSSSSSSSTSLSSSDNAGSSPSAGDSLIVWPLAAGGVWQITQGYNGPIDHQNWSSTWQYYYSFDLMRVDGDTAGQPVYSPVNGTIRWIDDSYGGMSIDMGDGYAFAYFHTDLA